MGLARVIRAITGLVVAIIVVAIVLHVLHANPGNEIVGDIHDAGAWLVGPFGSVFAVKGRDLHMILNWGLAAVVYGIVGHLIAGLLVRASVAGGGFGRPRPVM